VSLEGDKVAERVVDAIAGEDMDDSHHEKIYYRYLPQQ
jgi:hypothetical protein